MKVGNPNRDDACRLAISDFESCFSGYPKNLVPSLGFLDASESNSSPGSTEKNHPVIATTPGEARLTEKESDFREMPYFHQATLQIDGAGSEAESNRQILPLGALILERGSVAIPNRQETYVQFHA